MEGPRRRHHGRRRCFRRAPPHACGAGKPYVLHFPASAAWIFGDTALKSGDRFSLAGIEIDHRAAASPRGLRVLATILNVFGNGMTAEMSYYGTAKGAKVFAAGAFSLAGSIRYPDVRRVVENLWTRLAVPNR